MNVIGIVVEYNPFHNGHLYQIKKIKEVFKNSIIIVCMSSSFTQRGNISLLNKWEKTSIALRNGVDIVIELPYIFSTQSSDIFASYSVSLLNELKIDTLCFGTEQENINYLIEAANTQLNNAQYNTLVKQELDKGINYPTALNNALKVLKNIEIKTPNDLLALSYIKEIKRNNKNINIFNIKRTNDFHDNKLDSNIVSASNIRERILNNVSYENQVPKDTYNILKDKNLNNKYFEFLKYKIISEDNLNKYLDVDEGLLKRIKDNIFKSNSIDELIQNIKTKRYTYNKISRMLNHILCSFTKDENNIKELEYIRILGFTENGRKYLNTIKKEINIPILNKYDTKKYKALKIEKRITNIYSIIYDDINKKEIENKPISIN